MHQIDLADTVYLQRAGGATTVSTDSYLVPGGVDNLAYRAAVEFFRAVGTPGGVYIRIEKRIPVAAGLAGGSTDAAAVIRGLNILYACNLGLNEMLEIGSRVGSDVPFCVLGGTALARGRGEILAPLKLAAPLSMVLVKPDFVVSTREVYQGLAGKPIVRRPDTEAVRAALACGDIKAACSGMENVLETVTLEWHPEIYSIKQAMLGLGALKALMSGSGPSVFGIFDREDAAREAFDIMKRHYSEVFLTKSYGGDGGHHGGKEIDPS